MRRIELRPEDDLSEVLFHAHIMYVNNRADVRVRGIYLAARWLTRDALLTPITAVELVPIPDVVLHEMMAARRAASGAPQPPGRPIDRAFADGAADMLRYAIDRDTDPPISPFRFGGST